MEKKTKDMTPEEASKVIMAMVEEHLHKMRTDPEYRRKAEEQAKNSKLRLYRED